MQHAVAYGLGVATSPIPIATILLILSSRGVTRRAVAFAVAWVGGIATAAAVSAAVVRSLDASGSGHTWIDAAELVVGVVFIVIAARLWFRSRPGRWSPSWLDALDRFGPMGCAALGFVLSFANPKVEALCFGAAVAVARDHANAPATASAVLVFTALGAAGVLLPIAAYLVAPTGSAQRLATARNWFARRERGVFSALALALGALFIQDALRSLP